MQDTEVNQWNMLIHLSQLVGFFIPLGNVIAPLILWQMKKDEDPRIDQHGCCVLFLLGFCSLLFLL